VRRRASGWEPVFFVSGWCWYFKTDRATWGDSCKQVLSMQNGL